MRGVLRTAILSLMLAAPAAWPQMPSQALSVPDEQPEPPEQIVAGISHGDIDITTNFNGSDIIIYGAIKRQTPIPDDPPLDVIVAVQGPSKSVTIRKKERRLGVWVNTESVSVGAAPEFYVVASTRSLPLILPPDEDARYRISIPQVVRAFAGEMTVSDTVPFTEALLELRTAAGLYRMDQGAVRLAEQTLFRADVRMPANVVEGTYSLRILLLRNGKVIDTYRAPIDVRKVGLERWLFNLSLEKPFLYGLMSLALAVAAGWASSVAFRGLKRN